MMTTDQSLRRADELLTELVELVETARTLPMSSSCVLPRERVLDLLDELRETLPPEIEDARRLLANRDDLLHAAFEEATAARERAAAEAEATLADATERAATMTHDAEVEAYELVEAGKAEHGRLVSATGVHQAAAKAAAELRVAAEDYDRTVREQADTHHESARADADRYSADVRADAERYAAIQQRLFRAIAEASGARVVIDSSKSIAQALILRRAPELEVSVVPARWCGLLPVR